MNCEFAQQFWWMWNVSGDFVVIYGPSLEQWTLLHVGGQKCYQQFYNETWLLNIWWCGLAPSRSNETRAFQEEHLLGVDLMGLPVPFIRNPCCSMKTQVIYKPKSEWVSSKRSVFSFADSLIHPRKLMLRKCGRICVWIAFGLQNLIRWVGRSSSCANSYYLSCQGQLSFWQEKLIRDQILLQLQL